MTYCVQFPSIDRHRLYGDRHSAQAEARPTVKINQQPNFGQRLPEYDAPERIFYQQTPEGHVLRGKRKKIKLSKHLRREVTDKKKDNFTNRVLKIPEEDPFDET